MVAKNITFDLFADGGKMGRLMREYDWCSSPLGHPDTWPQALRTACRLTLASPFPMFMTWGPQMISMYNDAYSEVLGKKHPEALGGQFPDIWAEVWHKVGPLAEKVLKGESSYFENFPLQMLRQGHEEQTWFTFSYSPLRDDEGEIAGLHCVCKETTAQVLAEAQLLELNGHLEEQVAARTAERDRVWQNSPDLLLIIGRDGSLLAVNPAWTTILGYGQTELLGQHFGPFVHPDDVEPTAAAIEQASVALLEHFEVRVRHKDGTYRWFNWTAAAGEGGIYANGRHITAERGQSEALKAAEGALRQAQKMEAVGQLTGGLAHDFNNLLAGVVGNLQLMRVRFKQGRHAEILRYIDNAESVADRAASLTHRLLAFSRQQTLDPKVTNVNQLVGSMLDLIQRSVGPQIELWSLLNPKIWNTLCDPGQLETALLNLAINARDAMPEGGQLTIETANVVLDQFSTAVSEGAALGEYVVIDVTDTGTGMAPDVVARAFDPFFTTKPIGQGTGLGLSMVFGFVKQSGGHIRLFSRPGIGTTVRIKLPRTIGAVQPVRAEPQQTEPLPATTRATVVLVEDEATLRNLLMETLTDLGYTVLPGADATEGLRILQSSREVDLLVTDVGLPGYMNGRQLADSARASRQSLKVLFITGYAESTAINKGVLGERTQVLTKPFNLAAFANKVSALVAVD